jgi:hypothetical protein
MMMAKSKKSKAETAAPKTGRCSTPGLHSAFDRAEVENVQYFLRALNQISLALNALGYAAEAEMLAQVKMELHQNIFGARQPSMSLVEDLH